ncbi:MAG: NAD(P)-dependent oxidoreductase [Alphaproteobacteria bacterium]|nr:NAD(P)-dependent oxidoreductase [Alphaproteobacteria bacterium]
MSKKIGFIGVGLMGHGAAKNILEGGYPLEALAHRNRQPVDDLVGRGAKEASSAAELASRVDILFTCVSDSRVLEKVVHGENGVLQAARPGLVLVDMTTAEPASTRALAEALDAKGAVMVDGPVTLTPKEAEEGRLNIMIGAEAAILDEIRPVLETFCARIFHTGPLGSAHTLKLINNFLTLGKAALTVEACTTAAKAGVDPEMMVELISVSGGDSASFQRMARLLTGDGDPSKAAFAIKNALKDVSYFWRLAEDQHAYAPLADGVRRWYDLAVALGHGDDLLPALFEMHGRLSDAPITLK